MAGEIRNRQLEIGNRQLAGLSTNEDASPLTVHIRGHATFPAKPANRFVFCSRTFMDQVVRPLHIDESEERNEAQDFNS